MDLSQYQIDAPVVDQAEVDRENWFRLRAGKFTCSRFGDLIGSGRGKDEEFSQAGWNYIYQVAGERLGSYLHEFEARSVRWGKEYEGDALFAYLMRTGGSVETDRLKTGTAAYCQLNDYVAGTPDALIDDDGTLEIKCPYTPQGHIRTVHENKVPEKYVWQVHGHMLVSGRKWCEFISFDPRIAGSKRLHVIHVERCESMLKTLEERLARANEIVCEIVGE